MEQIFYFYPNHDYLLTEMAVVSPNETTSYNYLAPIVTSSRVAFLPADGDNRVYDMPFDNDDWRGYSALTWAKVGSATGNTSCEAGAFYNVKSRKGLVIGSVEHDTWKTGIYVQTDPSSKNAILQLAAFGGLCNDRTNDDLGNKGYPPLHRHGFVSGTRVKSPKIMVGFFDDWRDGLEEYGAANNLTAPKLPWTGGAILGWQSWGGMAQSLNYEGAIEVSDFFANRLSNIKNNQGITYIILDSFWDNMNEEQLKAFVRHCKRNGQIAGIYYTPYSFWGKESELDSRIENSDYTFNDVVLRAYGKPRRIASFALDPTHPAIQQRVQAQIKKFIAWGYEYLKLDFMNNAALEADSFYDPHITTGMQAYNAGMKFIADCIDGKMFINLSIAPVFPAQYSHGRRISCDVWGDLNQSQYTLNSINQSWWLEQVYSVNDPDHVVYLDKNWTGSTYTYHTNWPENYNRIRTTTSLMCGTLLLGDNLSLEKGSCRGIQAARDRTIKMTRNKKLIEIARLGKMFRPVEGAMSESFSLFQPMAVDKYYTLDTGEVLYLVAFNFDKSNSLTEKIFARIGVTPGFVSSIHELWNDTTVDNFNTHDFRISVPPCDVCVYRIDKK